MADERQLIHDRIAASVEMKQRLLDNGSIDAISEIADSIAEAYERGAKVLLFGNGGSATDAQHLCAELVGRFRVDRAALPAFALSENVAALTAIGNDYSYDEVFARQVDGLGQKGDVAIGLTTSGNSENVVRGLEKAREKGLVAIALTGASGGRVADVSTRCLRIPSDETARIQEGHMVVGHVLCELVERRLFPDAS